MKEEQTYKKEPVPLDFSYKGKSYKGHAIPLSDTCSREVCFELEVVLNNISMGIISSGPGARWNMSGVDQGLINIIGEKILLWYE
jgi:hypothetical protein